VSYSYWHGLWPSRAAAAQLSKFRNAGEGVLWRAGFTGRMGRFTICPVDQLPIDFRGAEARSFSMMVVVRTLPRDAWHLSPRFKRADRIGLVARLDAMAVEGLTLGVRDDRDPSMQRMAEPRDESERGIFGFCYRRLGCRPDVDGVSMNSRGCRAARWIRHAPLIRVVGGRARDDVRSSYSGVGRTIEPRSRLYIPLARVRPTISPCAFQDRRVA